MVASESFTSKVVQAAHELHFDALTASLDTFAAPSGWGDVFGGGSLFDREELVRGLKGASSLNGSGFAFKKWPAHTAMQVAIAAALPLFHENNALPESILIEAPVFRYCDRPNPKDTDDARFSFQYNVAQAILDGKVELPSFSPERFTRPELQRLIQSTKLVMDPTIPASFPSMEVRVRLPDGRSSRSDRWSGHWKSPASSAELEEKFMKCAGAALSRSQAVEVHTAIQGMRQSGSLEQLLQVFYPRDGSDSNA